MTHPSLPSLRKACVCVGGWHKTLNNTLITYRIFTVTLQIYVSLSNTLFCLCYSYTIPYIYLIT